MCWWYSSTRGSDGVASTASVRVTKQTRPCQRVGAPPTGRFASIRSSVSSPEGNFLRRETRRIFQHKSLCSYVHSNSFPRAEDCEYQRRLEFDPTLALYFACVTRHSASVNNSCTKPLDRTWRLNVNLS